jgi:hypothetical protein
VWPPQLRHQSAVWPPQLRHQSGVWPPQLRHQFAVWPPLWLKAIKHTSHAHFLAAVLPSVWQTVVYLATDHCCHFLDSYCQPSHSRRNCRDPSSPETNTQLSEQRCPNIFFNRRVLFKCTGLKPGTNGRQDATTLAQCAFCCCP